MGGPRPAAAAAAREAPLRRNPPRHNDARAVRSAVAPPGVHDSPDAVHTTLEGMREWKVRTCGPPLPAADNPYAAAHDAAGAVFFAAVGMERDASDEAGEAGTDVTYVVGDTVLIKWDRDDPLEPDDSQKDLAVARIEAIFQLDGVVYIVPRWGRAWSDIVLPHFHPIVGELPPDAFMRRRREVFWEADAPPGDPSRRLLVERGICSDANAAHQIVRACEVRHVDTFASADDRAAFEARRDCYTCAFSHDGALRFEDLPRPGAAPRLVTRPGGPTVADVFSGGGYVSVAAREAGLRPIFLVEHNHAAFEASMRNMRTAGAPEAASRCMSAQAFLEAVREQERTGRDLGVPRRGEVDVLHMSPPCQALSDMNGNAGLDRFVREMLPLLILMGDLVEALRPAFVSVEEVPRFLIARMPRVEPTKRADKQTRGNRKVGEDTPAKPEGAEEEQGEEQLEEEVDDVEAVQEGEQLVQGGAQGPLAPRLSRRAAAAALAAQQRRHEKEKVRVRAWLWLVPRLLEMGFQVDMRVLCSAHYGVPQARQRLWLAAARAGYVLPSWPIPRYHCAPKGFAMLRDDALVLDPQWRRLGMASDVSLPSWPQARRCTRWAAVTPALSLHICRLGQRVALFSRALVPAFWPRLSSRAPRGCWHESVALTPAIFRMAAAVPGARGHR
jgi:site-specific DNA-cytosine methylase